jgi:thiol-disulfide isomerase/thioredoxin
MKPRILLYLSLGIALLAPACGGKGGAETAGQTIRAATSYNVIPYAADKRRTPKGWAGTDISGATLRSNAFRGGVTVVNFWASWCAPCRKEQPELEKVSKDYATRGVRFLGVDIRDTVAAARAHVDEYAVSYPSVFNPDSTIAYKYRVIFIPTTFVLDRSGRIAAKIIGPTNEGDLQRLIDSELAA